MATTKCLYIDDDRQEFVRGVGARLKVAFALEYPQAELELEVFDFEEGEARLESEPGRYHLVVVDIFEGHPDQQGTTRGWSIIESLRGTGPAVIAVSSHSNVLAASEDHGAHETLSKEHLRSDIEHRHLRRKIANALRAADVTPPVAAAVEFRSDDQDLMLEAAIHSVGAENLQRLVLEICSATPSAITIKLVRPGLSGAVVFNCYCDVAGGEDEEFLLKVSRDGYKARREAEAWNRVRGPAERLFPKLLSSSTTVPESNGWFALGIAFRHGQTLTDWLARTEDAPTQDHVRLILTHIFGAGGLSAQYERSAKQLPAKRSTEVLLEQTMTLGRRAGVLAAIEEIRPLVAEKLPAYVARLGAPEDFFRYQKVGELEAKDIPAGTCAVRTHGDLHGRNVLISDPLLVALLDPADMADAHPATDWARMRADILLMGLAAQGGAHDWDGLIQTGAWREVVRRTLTGEPVAELAAMPAAAATALGWLTDGTAEIFSGLSRMGRAPATWELHLVTAVEFMRATTRRAILSMPLRVLALVAAIDALDAAAQAVPVES